MSEITTEQLEQAAINAAVKAKEVTNPLEAIHCLADSQVYMILAQAHRRGHPVEFPERTSQAYVPDPRTYT